ncbi:MAG: IPT/TIG domain-containing protein, partial [Sediminibacterium sp.]|uniref:IPT/TIG domain-containing protein n=1 Tax=Sediminibacterium sp. TaxID=1917865 RepID=UPI00271F6063
PTSGARTGGTSVVVTGTDLTGATGVTFGGVAATAFTVNSATQITATAPAGAANGPVDVRVTTPGGVSANTAADDFTYTGPVVQGLFQAGCPDVYGSTTTTYSFAAQASGAFTDAGGTTCRARKQPGLLRYNYTYTVTSTLVDATFSISGLHGTTTTITAPGTYTISPQFAGGEADTGLGLQYGTAVNNPFDEDSATQVHEQPLGGTYAATATGPNPSGSVTVTITDGFIDLPGALVTLDSTPSPGFVYTQTSGVLRFGSSMAIPGPGALLTTPSLAYLLQPGVAFTLNHSVDGTGRRLSGVTCTGATATLDAANNRFTLAALADRATATCVLAHSLPPAITAVPPATGPAAGGTAVTITGTNFTGVTAVRFGANAATSFTVNSATSITAVAPAGTGAVDVSVSIGDLASANTAADNFTYVDPPTVTALSPATGPVAGGTVVTVTGTNLTGVTAVQFGGVAATAFTVDSANSLTATAPAGAAGVASVIVTTPGGLSADTAADDFTYVVAPTVAAVAANVAFNSAGQAVTLSPSGVFTTLAVVAQPTNGTVTITGTTATYVPTAGFFGADSFTYTATGPGGTSAPATVSLTVATPPAPTVAAVASNVGFNSAGQAVTLSPSGVFTTLAVVAQPTNGTVTITGTTATYVPTAGFFGTDSFT